MARSAVLAGPHSCSSELVANVADLGIFRRGGEQIPARISTALMERHGGVSRMPTESLTVLACPSGKSGVRCRSASDLVKTPPGLARERSIRLDTDTGVNPLPLKSAQEFSVQQTSPPPRRGSTNSSILGEPRHKGESFAFRDIGRSLSHLNTPPYTVRSCGPRRV